MKRKQVLEQTENVGKEKKRLNKENEEKRPTCYKVSVK